MTTRINWPNGIPPVGTICEFYRDHEFEKQLDACSIMSEWLTGDTLEVVAIRESPAGYPTPIVWNARTGRGSGINEKLLRPIEIKSEAEKLRDEQRLRLERIFTTHLLEGEEKTIDAILEVGFCMTRELTDDVMESIWNSKADPDDWSSADYAKA